MIIVTVAAVVYVVAFVAALVTDLQGEFFTWRIQKMTLGAGLIGGVIAIMVSNGIG